MFVITIERNLLEFIENSTFHRTYSALNSSDTVAEWVTRLLDICAMALGIYKFAKTGVTKHIFLFKI